MGDRHTVRFSVIPRAPTQERALSVVQGMMGNMKLTPTEQRNAVSQGIALGILACGYGSIEFNKVKVDLAFTSAFRDWPYQHHFPQVHTDLNRSFDGARVLSRAGERQHTSVLYWKSEGGSLDVHARQSNFDPEDSDDLKFAASVICDDVSLEGWKALAQDFIDRLNPGRVDLTE